MATFRITPADVSLLMQLIGDVVDTRRNLMVYDSVSVLTVPDAVAPAVQQILADPNWRTRGTVTALKDYAAAWRRRVAAAGTTASFDKGSGGIKIATDDNAVFWVAHLVQGFNSGALTTSWFKDADGAHHQVTATEVTAIHRAVATHIDACHAAEAAAVAAIDAGTATTHSEVDAFFTGIT